MRGRLLGKKISSYQIIISGFLGVILIGTLLLMLPVSAIIIFYTGQNVIADGRRGLGLGLALCKSIVEAHGGTIALTDNSPSGCCFTFSLPGEEVQIDE